MKKLILHIITILCLPALANAQLIPVYGAERAGLSALSFLKNDVSPRSVGMAGTSASLNGDAYSIYHNVAGIADVDQTSFAVTNSFLGAGINQSFVSGIFPFKSKTSSLGISLNSLTSGAIEERTEFQPEGTGRKVYATNLAFGVSYAQQLSRHFTIGGTVKYIYENLAEFTNHTANVDVGFLYDTEFKDLRFAVLIRNFGGNSSLSGSYIASSYNRTAGTSLESNTFPNIFSLAISMVPWKNKRHSLLTAFQLNHPNDNAENYALGVEYQYLDLLFARAGLKINVRGQSYPSFGFGTRIMLGAHPLHIDYATIPTNYLGWQHVFGLRFSLNKNERWCIGKSIYGSF